MQLHIFACMSVSFFYYLLIYSISFYCMIGVCFCVGVQGWVLFLCTAASCCASGIHTHLVDTEKFSERHRPVQPLPTQHFETQLVQPPTQSMRESIFGGGAGSQQVQGCCGSHYGQQGDTMSRVFSLSFHETSSRKISFNY